MPFKLICEGAKPVPAQNEDMLFRGPVLSGDVHRATTQNIRSEAAWHGIHGAAEALQMLHST